ncbi:hypothetical protein ACFV1L_21305 [Kitasatospora sp. NPDC059646]|uniref:hypothetical protein n=1 Tax=Kitasatospora sp. NPDC059646 TaxID=3346893 RepID=UPI0036874198
MSDSLLLALVAVAGPLAGVALNSFTSSRTERLKIEATQQEAARQQDTADRARASERRVEHLRWRRDRRQAAYSAFLHSLGEITQLCKDGMVLYANGIPDRDRAEDVRTAITAALKDSNSRLATVRLEGPRPLAEAAVMFHVSVSFHGQWTRDRLTDGQTARSHMSEHVEFLGQATVPEAKFLEEAEKALAELMDVN